jgi:hypothetical protein
MQTILFTNSTLFLQIPIFTKATQPILQTQETQYTKLVFSNFKMFEIVEFANFQVEQNLQNLDNTRLAGGTCANIRFSKGNYKANHLCISTYTHNLQNKIREHSDKNSRIYKKKHSPTAQFAFHLPYSLHEPAEYDQKCHIGL